MRWSFESASGIYPYGDRRECEDVGSYGAKKLNSFDHPANLAGTTIVLSAVLRDRRLDAALAQPVGLWIRTATPVGVNDPGFPQRSAARTEDRRNRVDKHRQLRAVVAVRAAQDRANGHAREDMVLVGIRTRRILGFGVVFRAFRQLRPSATLPVAASQSRPSLGLGAANGSIKCLSLATNGLPLNSVHPNIRGRPGSPCAKGDSSHGSIGVNRSASTVSASVLRIPLLRNPMLRNAIEVNSSPCFLR